MNLDPIRPYVALIKTGLFVACVVAAFAYGCSRGAEAGRQNVRENELAQAERDAETERENRRAAEQQAERYRLRAEAQEAISAQYLEDLKNAQSKGDQLAADLRAGDLRFRKLWSECQTMPAAGGAPASAGAPSGAADDRAASAGRIVRAAAACDAQVRGLQAILIGERK